MGLSFNLLDRSPFTLSGGEKRRVALAAALAHEPELLLLDEPEVGMDLRGQKHVRELIQRLKNEGKALLVATHDVDAAMGWADRCVVLKKGRVADTLALTDPWPEGAGAGSPLIRGTTPFFAGSTVRRTREGGRCPSPPGARSLFGGLDGSGKKPGGAR